MKLLTVSIRFEKVSYIEKYLTFEIDCKGATISVMQYTINCEILPEKKGNNRNTDVENWQKLERKLRWRTSHEADDLVQ